VTRKRNSRLWDFRFRRVVVDESQSLFKGKHEEQQIDCDAKTEDFALVNIVTNLTTLLQQCDKNVTKAWQQFKKSVTGM
jgi:hypothetical protein